MLKRLQHFIPYTKEQVDALLKSNNMTTERGRMYDETYVACMCKADYLGRSVPDEKHLAMFVKDMIDDPDAEDGFVFNRFYADVIFNNDPIEWTDML